MQKAFEKITEMIEEMHGVDPMYYGAEVRWTVDKAIEIVNQVAEEYSHRNSDLVIDSSHRIEGLDDVIERLQYKADNIKAKLEPSYFTECIDYLKSLPKCDDGWIPCSERLPSKEEYLKDDGRFIVTDGNRAYEGLFDIYDGEFKKESSMLVLVKDECVIAWQHLPTAYVKGE